MTNRANYNPLLVTDIHGRKRIIHPGVIYPAEKPPTATTASTPPARLLTTAAAAQTLGIQPRSLRSLMKRHGFIPTKWRNALYWNPLDIDQLKATRRERRNTSPPGYISTSKACLILMVVPSSLQRYEQRGLIKALRLQHVTSGGSHAVNLYKESAVRRLADRLRDARRRVIQARKAQYLARYSSSS